MNQKELLYKIQKELYKYFDPAYKTGAERYFKEHVRFVGVRVPHVRKVASVFFINTKDWDKKEFLHFCKLLIKKENEYQTISLSWLFKSKKIFEIKDFIYFELLFKENVSNWSTCDDLCSHAFGYFLFIHPELLPKVFSWTKSKNRWVRRASAVSLLYSIRRGQSIKQAFKTADALLTDNDDLVQKGYGWLLKEVSNKNPELVMKYVMKNKMKMPRTALRCAIEKLPKNGVFYRVKK